MIEYYVLNIAVEGDHDVLQQTALKINNWGIGYDDPKLEYDGCSEARLIEKEECIVLDLDIAFYDTPNKDEWPIIYVPSIIFYELAIDMDEEGVTNDVDGKYFSAYHVVLLDETDHEIENKSKEDDAQRFLDFIKSASSNNINDAITIDEAVERSRNVWYYHHNTFECKLPPTAIRIITSLIKILRQSDYESR